MASQSRLLQDRHIRSIYLPRYQTRYPAIHLGQAASVCGYHHHEGYRHIPGRIHRRNLRLLLERHHL
jgi:hypothetical protein